MKDAQLRHFLIVFDRAEGRQISFEEYPDSGDAVLAYRELEAENRNRAPDKALDIVLVGSDSRETVRVTHASYFSEQLTATTVSQYLRQFASDNGAGRKREPSPHQPHLGIPA